MLDWLSFRVIAVLMLKVPGNQPIQIVAVGSVGAEISFIKQAFDAATDAGLVGVILLADRPAHIAMPAAAKHHQSGPCHARRHHAQRPSPTRLLFLFNHRPQPVTGSKA
jgi:hypothetical protein